MITIKCCYGCVAPKRHSGCHAGCSEYKAERAMADAQQEDIRKQIDNRNAIREIMWHGKAKSARRKGKKVV